MLSLDPLGPGTPACRLALSVAERHHSPALLHHCVRSGLLARTAAHVLGLEVDEELLHVASLLHDLGLEAAFDSHRVPFEVAGGEVGWVFAAGCGWTEERRRRVSEVVVRHMADSVDPAADPEAHVLELATAADIGGRELDTWAGQDVAGLLAAFPRLDLAVRFAAAFVDQAERKPRSAAATGVRAGLPDRLAAHPWG